MSSIKKDKSGNPYVEVRMGNGEWVRVTFRANGWPEEPTFRMQIKPPNKPPRQGPEFPCRISGELVQAMIELAGGHLPR